MVWSEDAAQTASEMNRIYVLSLVLFFCSFPRPCTPFRCCSRFIGRCILILCKPKIRGKFRVVGQLFIVNAFYVQITGNVHPPAAYSAVFACSNPQNTCNVNFIAKTSPLLYADHDGRFLKPFRGALSDCRRICGRKCGFGFVSD